MEKITDRQKEIIDAAGKLLTESCIGGLTIKNIAREMQFSESAVYRHFQSKEEIVLLMLEFLAANMNERLGGLKIGKMTPPEKLLAIFENQLLFFSKNKQYVVAVFSDGLMEQSESINQRILAIMQVKMRHLFPVVFEGQKKGYFTDEVKCEELIHVIMGAFRLQMFKWRAMGFDYDIQKSGMESVRALLKVIAK